MQAFRTPDQMQAWATDRRRQGRTIGFVPTMGFLHAGHTSLMDLARPECDELVVSVYVNPLQFGPSEDLDRYPRDPEGDARLCTQHGADVLFMPPELYPDGFATAVHVHGLTDGLDGARRPGHFEGVATVCARLFGLTGADLAVFGEKDFQQLLVIRRMVTDLAVPVRIVPGPIVRDTDGLALSSRNKFLSDGERRRARSLSEALLSMQASRETNVPALIESGRSLIDCDRLDYLEVVDAETLRPIEVVGDRPVRALVAAFYGATRLIDNAPIGPEMTWT